MNQSTGAPGGNPLGRPAIIPEDYAPEALYAIRRSDARQRLGIEQTLPFTGVDIWNVWELTWLDPSGKPQIAIAELSIDAASPNLVESKSLKLYLASLAMTSFDSPHDVTTVIRDDLSTLLESPVQVRLSNADAATSIGVADGCSIDETTFERPQKPVDAAALRVTEEPIKDATLHSHLFRSLCPVTGQPDYATVIVRYSGNSIDPGSLITYLVSYRTHQDFHESCVERIFLDLKSRCESTELAVQAQFTRRGGIDINPYRTDTNWTANNARLIRQ